MRLIIVLYKRTFCCCSKKEPKELDILVDKFGYRSRTELIREAIEEKIASLRGAKIKANRKSCCMLDRKTHKGEKLT